MKPAIFRAALAVAVVAGCASVALAETETFEKAFSLQGVERLRVENVNGAVELKTWDRDYVRVTAVKSGSSWALANTSIKVTQPGSEIRIETLTPHTRHFFSFLFGGHRTAKVEYELLAPARVAARLETVNGAVRVDGRRAELRAETVNGSLDLRDIHGPVHGETVNGRITLSADIAEDTRLETVNGSIQATFPAASSFRYDLSSMNGSMEVGDRRSHAHAIGIKSFEGEINGGRALLKAETVNGGIHIFLSGAGSPGATTSAPAPVADSHDSDD